MINKERLTTCLAIPFDGFKEQVRIINDLKRKFKSPKIEIIESLIYCETVEIVQDL